MTEDLQKQLKEQYEQSLPPKLSLWQMLRDVLKMKKNQKNDPRSKG